MTQPPVSIKTAARRHLPASVAFALQASIVIFFLAGSSAPTPLYSTYQAEWGFSPITTTIIFGIYALAVLTSLLVVGSLSDHVGRRPVLLVTVALQIVTMAIFVDAHNVATLIGARIIQGLSTGAAVGAIGAGLLDISKTKGTVANSVAPIAGTASGSLISGLLVQYLPAPTHLVYEALLIIFVLQLIGVWFMRETSARTPGARQSLKLDINVPKHIRTPFVLVVPTLIAVWSFAGLYGALGPSLVHLISGSTSHFLGGLALGIGAGAGAVSVAFTRKLTPYAVSVLGTSSLIVGVRLSVIATGASSLSLFYIGTAVAGVGFGSAFQGAIRTIVPLAEAHERSGVLSLVYVVSYLAMGLPAVIAGVFVVHGGGLLLTARYYSLVEMALAAAALIGVVGRRRSLAKAERADLSLMRQAS